MAIAAAEPEPLSRTYRDGHQGEVIVSDRHTINRSGLAAVSLAIALICSGALALLVRDRWNRPEIKTADEARYATTGEAAQAVGAQVLPTDPKLAVEPAPVGPKQAQPANPN
jgi:hypothetical protein